MEKVHLFALEAPVAGDTAGLQLRLQILHATLKAYPASVWHQTSRKLLNIYGILGVVAVNPPVIALHPTTP